MLSIGEIRLIPCSGISFHHDNSQGTGEVTRQLRNGVLQKNTPKLGVQNQVANYWNGNWKPQRKLWAAQSCTLWMMVDADVVGLSGGGGWTMVKQFLTYPLPVVKQRQSAAPEFHLKQRKSSMFETTHVISHHDIDSDAVHQYIAFESGSTASFYKIPILPFLFSQCIQRVSPQRSTPQRCTLAGAPQYLLHIMHFSKSCCEHHSWSCPDASGKLAVMHH